VTEGSGELAIKVNTGEVIYEFFAETAEQKECLRRCLQTAEINAYEANISGKISKRNFDRLCALHEDSFPDFKREV
jgi:hypothetical protein